MRVCVYVQVFLARFAFDQRPLGHLFEVIETDITRTIHLSRFYHRLARGFNEIAARPRLKYKANTS